MQQYAHWASQHQSIQQRVPISTAKFANYQTGYVNAHDSYQIADELTNESMNDHNKQNNFDRDFSSVRNINGLQKFSPHKDHNVLLKNFEIKFKELIIRCSTKLSALVQECVHSLWMLKTCLDHYPQRSHLDSYFSYMHTHSTDTKINLLNMLTAEQRLTEQLNNDNNNLQSQCQQLKKQLLNVQDECAKIKQQLTKSETMHNQKVAQNKQLLQQIQALTISLCKIQKSSPKQHSLGSSSIINDESCTNKQIRKPIIKASVRKKNQVIQDQDSDDIYRFMLTQAIAIQQHILTQ